MGKESLLLLFYELNKEKYERGGGGRGNKGNDGFGKKDSVRQ